MAGSKFYWAAVAAFAVSISLVHSQTITPANPCPADANSCKLPNCYCNATEIPGGLPRTETPQLVFLTFDDAVSVDNFPFYQTVLKGRKNPNGHQITATFFVSHEYTNYSMLHELTTVGHEVALHSISHNTNSEYWRNLTTAQWNAEVMQQRDQMVQFGKLSPAKVQGFRAPHLQGGGDTMYDALKKGGMKWECSRPTLNHRNLWPYTNDFASIQDCQIPPCPIGQYTGFWTVPMIDLIGDNGQGCAMADTCTPVPVTPAATLSLLKRNFEDSYNGNRAPFGIYVHHAWMNGTEGADSDTIWERRRGYEQFLDHLATLKDVYVVSISRALEWVKTPTKVADLPSFKAFQVEDVANTCTTKYECKYTADRTPPTITGERYMSSCIPCPPYYPWVGNNLGRNPYSKKLRTSAP